MEAFKSLWRPRGNIAIPNYTYEDGVDLQVKASLYTYKRFNIAKSTDKLVRQEISGVSDADLANLDKSYNVPEFERVVSETDPHRVLIDWPKNRYRAMSILAHMPQMEQSPSFSEPYFSFSVLEADSSNDEYIRTSSTSGIYAEHNSPLEIRREIAASILRKYVKRDSETRSLIILEYSRYVATEIQVARIYKAMIGKVSAASSPTHSAAHSPRWSPAHSPTHSPSHSPVSSRSSSPVRQVPGSPPRPSSPTRPGSPSRFPKVAVSSTTSVQPKLTAAPKLPATSHTSPHGSPHMSPHQSPHGSPPSSPHSSQSPAPRLRSKSSQPNLRLGAAPPNLAATSGGGVAPTMDAGRKHILQQARMAVRARLDKEQRALAMK